MIGKPPWGPDMQAKIQALGRPKIVASAIALSLAAGLSVSPAQAAQEDVERGGFTYDLPTLPDTVPLLASQLESLQDRARYAYDEGRAELAEMMPEGSAMVAGYEHSQQWSVTGQTDALIALGSETYSYTGGAHGNTAFDALVWDVASDRPIGILGLFTNRYLGLSMIDEPFCVSLREQQVERMGEIAEDDFWADCPSLDQVAIAPTGSDNGPFTGFRVRVPPYIAGPYAAGSFDVDVPVTAEMLEQLKLEYRSSFALPAE